MEPVEGLGWSLPSFAGDERRHPFAPGRHDPRHHHCRRHGGERCHLRTSEAPEANGGDETSAPIGTDLWLPADAGGDGRGVLLERARRREDADVDEVAYLVAEAIVAHAGETAIGDISPH